MYVEDNGDIIESNAVNGGYQIIYKFQNGYGASVVQHDMSYGLELAVIKYKDDGQWDLTYETPITSDVLGHLTPEELKEHLDSIRKLPGRTVAPVIEPAN